jgi:O-antigen/teichoic acid export membrane protein
MSNPFKRLAAQTAIYGLSSIVGRFLNYLLVPLHVATFSTVQYGVITEMYAYVAFLVVMLTFGMETAFFRFASQNSKDSAKVFSTSVVALSITTSLFILFSIIFSHPIADWLMYPDHNEYVIWFSIIVGLDALSAIPLAILRLDNKSFRFVAVNFSNVGINILLNLFFLLYCIPKYQAGETNWLISTFYNPEIGVGYVFIANLVASIVKFLLLSPQFIVIRFRQLSLNLLKQMLPYALPLLVAGLAGIVNETLDRVLLKRILANQLSVDEALHYTGIYGACYKLSIIMTLFIQAYRYAAEPFFFNHEKEKDSSKHFADIMTYFVLVCSLIFLVVLLYIDIFKFFIPGESYWEALRVVPILLLANICLGIYYNQSVWYKLSNKTMYGAGIAIFGAILTVVLNLLLIPSLNYMGAAWATLGCYFSMMVASYFLGQKHYPIPYRVSKVLGYPLLAVVFYFISSWLRIDSQLGVYLINSMLLLVFMTTIFFLERKNLQQLFIRFK